MALTIDELLKAQEESKKTVRVDVLLDADISAKIEDLEQQIVEASKDQRLGADPVGALQKKITKLRKGAADRLLTLEFEQLPGDAWAALQHFHPPRPGSLLDENFGYNVDEVAKSAIMFSRADKKYAYRVVEGAENEYLSAEQWESLFCILSGHDFAAIRDAVWGLNEWTPFQGVEAAKKARSESEKN